MKLMTQPSPLAFVVILLSFLLPVMLSLDFYTPLSYAFFASIYVFVWGKRSKVIWLLAVLFLGFASFWVFLSNLIYMRDLGGENLRLLIWNIPSRNLERALLLAVRTWSLSLISFSTLMILKPEELVDALMQQARLPIRWGYALWTTLNVIPLLFETEKTIRIVQWYRARKKGRAFLPASISMLASLIRLAERASIILTERGLERAVSPRHWFYPFPWRLSDTIFTVVSVLLSAGIFFALVKSGLFRFGLY